MMAEGIPRHGFTVTDVSSRRIGEITSGTFSPLLRKGIGIGYISTPDSQLGTTVQVLIRGSPNQGKIVKPPFYDETAYGWKRASSKDNSLTNPKLAP
jgi:aminomethyltransferase